MANRRETELIEAAISFWEKERPKDWTLEKHLIYSCYGSVGDRERRLYHAVAEVLKHRASLDAIREQRRENGS